MMTRFNRTVPVSIVVTGLLAGGADAGFTITTLVKGGDPVPGVGNVSRIDNIVINSLGDWLVEADTDQVDTDADSVLLRNGVLDLREGDPLPLPTGAALGSFDSITLNLSGDSAWNFFLDGTSGSTDDSGIYFNTSLVIQESALMTAEDFSPGTPLLGIFDVKINDAGTFVSVLTVDDPSIAGTVDRALIEFRADGGGGYDQFVVAREGELLPGQTELVADLGTGPHQSAYNDAGQILFFADLAGSTATDGTIWLSSGYDGYDRLLLAQEGSDSPVPERPWSSLASPELGLNNAGDHVYSGSLSGDTASNLIIVKNGMKFRQEGDPVTTGSGTWSLTSFGSGPIMIDDCGNVLWYGDWNDPDLNIDTGLFLNDTLLVQEGVTIVDGFVVDTIRGVTDGYTMSDDGRYIIFEGVLANLLEGAFLIDFGAPCAGVACPPDDCGNGDGMVNTPDLLTLLAAWGSPGGPCDLNGDGTVNTPDLLTLLADWGDCP